jgi:hypothetical protein
LARSQPKNNIRNNNGMIKIYSPITRIISMS